MADTIPPLTLPNLPRQPGDGVPATVEGGSPGNKPPTNPADTSTKVSATQFGGNPTGRKRKDNLPPGSPEAKEADRKKEAARKAAYRAQLRAANPPVLPSRVPITHVSTTQPGTAANQPQDTAEIVLGGNPNPALLEWTAEDVRELVEELLPCAEQYLVGRLTKKAAAAKLSKEILRTIEEDSRWDETTKRALRVALPRLCAKYLNQAGISAQYKDEIIVSLCLLRVFQRQLRLESKLDQLIAATKKPEADKPKEEKE